MCAGCQGAGDGQARVQRDLGNNKTRAFRIDSDDAGLVLQDEPAACHRTLFDHLALNDDLRGTGARRKRLNWRRGGIREHGAKNMPRLGMAAKTQCATNYQAEKSCFSKRLQLDYPSRSMRRKRWQLD